MNTAAIAAKSVACKAFAKVNLGLRIIGRREDGYHEVSTVMVPVRISDSLTFTRQGEGLSLHCPDLPHLPQRQNLVDIAVRALMQAVDFSFGLKIEIAKQIPPGAGMGGGSSDAAAALLAVNGMLPRSRHLDLPSLSRLAASLGADVPFFLGCNSVPPLWEAAVCSGKGEVVKPVGMATSGFWIVVAFPGFPVSTSDAYRDWDCVGRENVGRANFEPADAEREKALLRSLQEGDILSLARNLNNDLEGPIFRRHPSLRQLKDTVVSCGALGAVMTGSGSAVYGVCRTRDEAVLIKQRLEKCVSCFGSMVAFAMKAGVEGNED